MPTFSLLPLFPHVQKAMSKALFRPRMILLPTFFCHPLRLRNAAWPRWVFRVFRGSFQKWRLAREKQRLAVWTTWPSLFRSQTVQFPIFRGDENLRPAIAIEVGQDWLADAAPQRNGPEQPRLAVALAKGMQLTVVTAEEHLHPTVAIEVGSDQPADRPP